MDALKKLENSQPNKPYYGFAKLSKGWHEIECFRIVKNKYGKKTDGTNKSILVELQEQVLFLPQFFRLKLTDNDIQELNENINSNKKIYLYFGGRRGEKENE